MTKTAGEQEGLEAPKVLICFDAGLGSKWFLKQTVALLGKVIYCETTLPNSDVLGSLFRRTTILKKRQFAKRKEKVP